MDYWNEVQGDCVSLEDQAIELMEELEVKSNGDSGSEGSQGSEAEKEKGTVDLSDSERKNRTRRMFPEEADSERD